MPEPGQEALAIMNLRARCRTNHSLPTSGGILDQPAYLMDLFDVIDASEADYRRGEIGRAEDEALRAKLAGELSHGLRR